MLAAILYFGTLVVLAGVILYVRDRFRKPAPKLAVTFDDIRIVVTADGVLRDSVRWDKLITVGIRIEPTGYVEDAIMWILGGEDRRGCVYLSDTEGAQAMLKEMQRRLRGFDNVAVVKATEMLSGGVVVWRRA